MARAPMLGLLALVPLLACPPEGRPGEAFKEVAVLKGHEGEIAWASFSPDGRLIATTGKDGALRVWDATTGKQNWSIKERPGSGAVFSPDGKRVLGWVSGPGGEKKPGQVKAWDAATGKAALAHKDVPRGALAISPDGKRCAVKVGDSVKVFEVPSAK